MSNQPTFTETDMNNAIEMGLRSCDLYAVAAEDILCRSHLRKFLVGALESLMSRSDKDQDSTTLIHPEQKRERLSTKEQSMDKEMMKALETDGEKLRHLTGEDHGPEFLFDCEACGGEGYIARTVHVYEAGCGFSHPDVEETPCQACGGNGWFVAEAGGDR